ncbi:MAG: hypothetical protein AAFN93_03080 [Bacteroidota bacterium]
MMLVLFCVLNLLITGSGEMTDRDGLYLIIDGRKCLANKTVFNGDKYCVPDEPIVSVDHFVKITKMREAGETLFFDVDLDKLASKKLNLVQSKLHRPKFALILDNQLKGWVEIDSEGLTTQLRFYSTSFGSAIIEVHQYLLAIVKIEKE